MARYNPEDDKSFTDPYGRNQTGNAESPYNPTADQQFWGGSAGGAQEDVNRYRGQASGARSRTAYQTDLGRYDQTRQQGNEARGFTMGALGDLRAASRGEVPSAAEIQGKQMLDRSLQNQVAAAGSARGGPANAAAAYRNAATQGAMQTQQGMNDIAALRAQEQATARGQLAQTALGAQGAATNQGQADLGAAGLQQQSELTQRGLNQQGEQFYEGLGFNTKGAELNAALQRQQLADQRAAADRQAKLKDEEQEWGKKKDIINTFTGAISSGVSGLLSSDPAAKMNIGPVGVPPPSMGRFDEQPPMLSPPEAKNPTSSKPYQAHVLPKAEKDARSALKGRTYADLNAPAQTEMPSPEFHQALEKYGQEGSPYEDRKPPETGIHGTPKNYAAQREGQPGAMDFRPVAGESSEVAPGTKDFERYGAPMDLAAESPEWRGPKAMPKPPQGAFERFIGGMASAFQRPKVIYAQPPQEGLIPSGMMGKLPAARATPAASPTFSGSQGMLSGNPMGELKAHSDYATRFQRSPGSGPVGGGGFMSDPKAKREAFQEGVFYSDQVNADPEKKAPLPDYMKGHTSAESEEKQMIWSRDQMPQAQRMRREDRPPPEPRQPTSFQRDTATPRDVSPVDRGYQPAVQRQQQLAAAAGRPAPKAVVVPPPSFNAPEVTGQSKEPMLSPPEAKNPVYLGEAEDFEKERDTRERVNRAELREAGEGAAANAPSERTFHLEGDRRIARRAAEDKAGKEADALMAAYGRSLNEGASAAPVFEIEDEKEMAEANRAMAPSSYEYKPEFRPSEQRPGEVNVGPMADRMAADNVAGTAVRRTSSGMLAIDRDKGLKLVMGGLAAVQRQLDEMKRGDGGGRTYSEYKEKRRAQR